MFKWYGDAEVCYAFLSDVRADPSKLSSSFRKSRWFTRGWTLQELIAPGVVYFYATDWKFIGCREKLLNIIVQVTKISPTYFATGDLSQYSAAQKMSWAANRSTTRPEDVAYCLLGLFDINMPLLYGEGERAFQRLQEEILRQFDDDSLFIHNDSQILATSPSFFHDCDEVLKGESWPYKSDPALALNRNLSLNRNGVRMSFPVAQASFYEVSGLLSLHKAPLRVDTTMQSRIPENVQPQIFHLALLNCGTSESASVLLLHEESSGVFVKFSYFGSTRWAAPEPKPAKKFTNTTLFISRAVTDQPAKAWAWRARNNKAAVKNVLRVQMERDFETPFSSDPTMTPNVRPAVAWGDPWSDALGKCRNKVVIKEPIWGTSGFQLQYVHVVDFQVTLGERRDEIHLIPYNDRVKGPSCFVFSTLDEQAFMVTVQPTGASVNAQLYTNIPEWKGKRTIEYVKELEKQRKAGTTKLSRYLAPQRLGGELGAHVQVRVDSRRQMSGWWVYITFTPIPEGADGISN
jgi:hypothetical protein